MEDESFDPSQIPLAPPRSGAAPPPKSIGDDAVVRMLLPVGRSAVAVAAGYFGLLSPLVFPAPIALVLGLLAVRDIRLHPQKHGMGRAVFAIVMGALGSLAMVFIVIALLLQ